MDKETRFILDYILYYVLFLVWIISMYGVAIVYCGLDIEAVNDYVLVASVIFGPLILAGLLLWDKARCMKKRQKVDE